MARRSDRLQNTLNSGHECELVLAVHAAFGFWNVSTSFYASLIIWTSWLAFNSISYVSLLGDWDESPMPRASPMHRSNVPDIPMYLDLDLDP